MAKIPTLHSGPISVLTKRSDIVAYTIRHTVFTPGFVSSTLEHELVSLKTLMAMYHEPEDLAHAYEIKLSAAFERIFTGDPKGNVNVTVTQSPIDESKFKLSITVADSTGFMMYASDLELSKDMEINADISMKIKFES